MLPRVGARHPAITILLPGVDGANCNLYSTVQYPYSYENGSVVVSSMCRRKPAAPPAGCDPC